MGHAQVIGHDADIFTVFDPGMRMSAEEIKGSGLTWFVRRGSVVRGPFSSAKIRHHVLDGRLTVEDEVSNDRGEWRLIASVAEVLPPDMRRDGLTLPDDRQSRRHRDRRQAIRSLLIVSLIVVGFIILVSLVGSGEQGVERDCGVAPTKGALLEGCDLSHVDWAGVDLSDARMANVRLEAARLSTTKLPGADLRYADLRSADLSYTDLQSAVLLGAQLRNADLTNADLRAADLSFADLSGARLGGARFDGAKLDGTIWADGKSCGELPCPR